MADHIILVENPTDWKANFPNLPVVAAKDYLGKPEYSSTGRSLRVLNLCRSYRYICFGQCAAKELQELARQLFDAFRSPLLRVEFRLQVKWRIATIKALHLHSLSPDQEEMFLGALSSYLNRRWRQPRARNNYRYDLAILHNPKEAMPPSNPKALQQFIKIGRECGVNVELIEKKDYGRLAEFDALFIRETTGIDHYTYQFAKKAESEGMVVIDDPDSILKCTNKVYLDELLRWCWRRNFSTPSSTGGWGFSTRRRCSSANTSCPRNIGKSITTNRGRNVRSGPVIPGPFPWRMRRKSWSKLRSRPLD